MKINEWFWVMQGEIEIFFYLFSSRVWKMLERTSWIIFYGSLAVVCECKYKRFIPKSAIWREVAGLSERANVYFWRCCCAFKHILKWLLSSNFEFYSFKFKVYSVWSIQTIVRSVFVFTYEFFLKIISSLDSQRVTLHLKDSTIAFGSIAPFRFDTFSLKFTQRKPPPSVTRYFIYCPWTNLLTSCFRLFTADGLSAFRKNKSREER